MSRKIAITGGHSTGLALIEEIRKQHPDWQIYYFGRKYALEGRKAPSFDAQVVSQIKFIKFISLTTGRLQRRFSFSALLSLLKIPYGFCQTLYWLIKIRPDLILSFGGYVSVPVVVVGWLLGIPSITHEQTQTIGLATKINSLFSKKVALAFPQLVSKFSSSKAVYTGMPLRDCLHNKTRPESLINLDRRLKATKKPLLYIATGKTGSQKINDLIKKLVPILTQKYVILHQVGELDFAKYQSLINKNYWPKAFLPSQEQGWALNKADLLVSRAGANITFEILFLKKAAIFIPLPFSSQEEQKKNAAWFVSLGGGKMLEQKGLSPKKLLTTIRQVLKDKEIYFKNLQKIKIKNGRQHILRLVEEIF